MNHLLLFAASHSPVPAKHLGCLCLLCSSKDTLGLPDPIWRLFPLRLCRFLVRFSSSFPAKSHRQHRGTEKVHHTYFTKERTKEEKWKEMLGGGGTWQENREGRGWKEMSSTSLRLSASRTLINENLKKKMSAGLFGECLDLVVWNFAGTCLPNVSLGTIREGQGLETALANCPDFAAQAGDS